MPRLYVILFNFDMIQNDEVQYTVFNNGINLSNTVMMGRKRIEFMYKCALNF